MRNTILFFAIILTSLSISAQECKLNRSTDPYTKETRLSTGFIQLEGGSLTIDADSRELDFLFSIEGTDRCYDNNSTAYIYFVGSKSKGSNRNGGSMNCEGLFHFIYKNAAGNVSFVQRMLTQKISHIVFVGNNKKEATITLGEKEQQIVMDLANCLVKEAKTLLK